MGGYDRAPRLSRRNYISIGLRGPVPLGSHAGGTRSFSWGDNATDSMVEDYLLRAVEQTRRNYHVHSERVYLAGVCEGAEVAYRVGLGMADRIAGVIALNRQIPKGSGAPLFRLQNHARQRISRPPLTALRNVGRCSRGRSILGRHRCEPL